MNIKTICLFFIFVLITNRYYSVDNDQDFISTAAGDVFSYRVIAESAPEMPKMQIPFQHAQRFLVPYSAGILAKFLGLRVELVMRLLVSGIFFLCLIFSDRFLNKLNVPNYVGTVLIFLVFANPYLVRIGLALPFLINDLGFVMGLILALQGLYLHESITLFIGIIVSVLCRQTSMVMIFPLAVSFISECYRGRWKSSFCIANISSISFILIGYIGTAKIAYMMSDVSYNVDHIIGMLNWIANDFDLKMLIDFLVRGATAFLVVIAILAFIFIKWKPMPYSYRWDDCLPPLLLIFASGLIALQPILAGPKVTGGNLARLSVLGLWGLVFGVAGFFYRKSESESPLVIGTYRVTLLILIGAHSFHHLFSWPGTWLLHAKPELFLALQVLISTLVVSVLGIQCIRQRMPQNGPRVRQGT